MLFAGSLSANGIVSPIIASFIVGIASFLGDMAGFFLARRFKHYTWIQAIITHEKHRKSWDLFDRHIAIISIFGKLVPVVRATPSIFAAIRGVKIRQYIVYSFLGSMLWGIVGIYLGNFLASYFGGKAISFILVIALLSVVTVLVHQGIKALRRKHKK